MDFVVLHHDDNPDILHPAGFPGAERGLPAWKELLRTPDRFHVVAASDWANARPVELQNWATRFAQRYFPESKS